jgi:hypothetical protein
MREVALALLLVGCSCFSYAFDQPPTYERLVYRGSHHAVDGRLATNLILPSGASITLRLQYPDAYKRGLKKTWACWLFPEDTWAVGGNSKIELFVDGKMITHFAVATGEWAVLIQSLAEHLTPHVPDPTQTYLITLRNAGAHEVRIRELWIRWLANQ